MGLAFTGAVLMCIPYCQPAAVIVLGVALTLFVLEKYHSSFIEEKSALDEFKNEESEDLTIGADLRAAEIQTNQKLKDKLEEKFSEEPVLHAPESSEPKIIMVNSSPPRNNFLKELDTHFKMVLESITKNNVPDASIKHAPLFEYPLCQE